MKEIVNALFEGEMFTDGVTIWKVVGSVLFCFGKYSSEETQYSWSNFMTTNPKILKIYVPKIKITPMREMFVGYMKPENSQLAIDGIKEDETIFYDGVNLVKERSETHSIRVTTIFETMDEN